jgi:hypothetical protein
MTTRRRVATFSFSPTESEDGANNDNVQEGKTDLERKLELLEARFTMPLDQPFAVAAAVAAPNGSNNSCSPATLDPENSSPASIPSTKNNNNSQHSFGFDTPSLTYPTDNTATTKRISTSPEVNNYQEPGGWQEIAAAHMAKIAQQSQDNTLLTSHVASHRSAAASETTTTTTTLSHSAAVCIQESPPFISPKPAKAASTNEKETVLLVSKNCHEKALQKVKLRSSALFEFCFSLVLTQLRFVRLAAAATTTSQARKQAEIGHASETQPAFSQREPRG